MQFPDSTLIKHGYKSDAWFQLPNNVKQLTFRDGFWWKHDSLFFPSTDGLRGAYVHDAHDAKYKGHVGVDNNLSRHYWWPGMRVDVRKYVAECASCQRNKPLNQAKAGLLQPIPIPDTPWSTMTMDLITDLPETEQKYDSVVVFVDKLTKMVHIAPCRKQISAETFATLYLANVVRYHGFQQVIISDRDTRWTSDF